MQAPTPGQLQTSPEEKRAIADAMVVAEPNATPPPTTGVQTRASKRAAAVPGSEILRELPEDIKRKIVGMAIHPFVPGLAKMQPLIILERLVTARNTCGALLASRKQCEEATRAMRLFMYRHTFCIWQMQGRLKVLAQYLGRNEPVLKANMQADREQFKLVQALAGKNPDAWKLALQTLKDNK